MASFTWTLFFVGLCLKGTVHFLQCISSIYTALLRSAISFLSFCYFIIFFVFANNVSVRYICNLYNKSFSPLTSLCFNSSHYLLHFTTVTQTEASSWTIKVPSSIKGLPGSCVVIPCSFTYPDPRKKVTEFIGMWSEASHQHIYHPLKSKIMQQYRNRTELLGDVRQKICTLKIDPLQQSDQGPFNFRIEMTDYERFSYKDNAVSITMISKYY